MTFTEATQAVLTGARTTEERLARIKAVIDATEEALFNAAAGGARRKYKINTGQSVVEVEYQSLAELRKQYTDMHAVYNELYGIATGGNVMVLRSAMGIN